MTSMDLATAKRLLEQGRLRELLQIPEGARGAQLEKLCKVARVKCHPDRGGCAKLAAVVGAAVDKILEQEGLREPAYASSAPVYETMLSFHLETLQESLQGVTECMGGTMPNTRVLKRKLKDLAESIAAAAKCVEGRLQFTTSIERDLCQELLELLVDARRAEEECRNLAAGFAARQASSSGGRPEADANKSRFPKTPAWMLAEHPAKVAELQLLQKEYQKAYNKRRMKISRGAQNTTDLDEAMAKLLQQALELTSKSGACDPGCFPPQHLWSGSVEGLEALHKLRKDYYSAVSRRSMRRNRGQPVGDVNEQIIKLRHSAWALVQRQI
jgi:hypothetical protein